MMEHQSVGVSVIMPAYCAEKTIQRAILSVLSQSHHNLELIIINDASTDSTDTIIKQFAKEDARIHILQNEKRLGVAASRQKEF